jgi:multidrug resistance efflux pump
MKTMNRCPTRLRRPAAATIALALLAACGGGGAPVTDLNLFQVARADLPITVKENAELQALRETIVRSEVEGQSTIIFLIPEGTYVQQGEKLVELDVSELVEKRATQAISVAKAESALAQARKEKEILAKELTTKENTARSSLLIADMELDKLLGRRGGGEGKNSDMVRKLHELVSSPPASPVAADAAGGGQPGAAPAIVAQVDPRSYRGLVDKVGQLLKVDGESDDGQGRDMGEMANRILQQVDKIRLAMAELKVKEDTLAHSRRLAQKQFITRNELDRDQLAWQSQVSQVTLAWNDLDLLINYELAKQRIQLEQDRDNARLEVERVLGSNDAAVTKADSELISKQAEFDLAKERLENLDRQIRSGVVFAPTPGLVVYARLDRDRRGGEAVREGVQVRERQDLIILPDTTRMRCVIKVQEAQVAMVRPGQPAYVQVEARPGEIYTGRVTSVAPTADSNSGWMTSDRKVYTTIVELDSDNPAAQLRSRMAASVTIVVETVEKTLPVPLQAVRRDRSVNYIWRQTPSGPTAITVEVGRHNAEQVEIRQGLAEGDAIYLVPPAGVAEPKFEQPAVPTLEPTKDQGPAARGAGDGGDSLRADGGERTDRPDRGPGNGRRGPGMGATSKKLTEMTAEELTQFRSFLPMMQGMADRARDGGDETRAKSLEEVLANLQKALDANDLETAQAEQDKLRGLMRQGRQNGGRGNGNAGSGDGQGGNRDGGDAPRRRGNRDDGGARGGDRAGNGR